MTGLAAVSCACAKTGASVKAIAAAGAIARRDAA